MPANKKYPGESSAQFEERREMKGPARMKANAKAKAKFGGKKGNPFSGIRSYSK